MSEKEYENKKELNNKQLEQVSGGGFGYILKSNMHILKINIVQLVI